MTDKRASALARIARILDPRPTLVECVRCTASPDHDCYILIGDPDWPRPYHHPERRQDAITFTMQTINDLVES